MLQNENIICISSIAWDFVPVVMHHMMTRLARKNRILFVDPPVAYSNLLINPSMWKFHLKKTSLWLRGVYKLNENLYIYYPPPLLLQYGHFKFADIINQMYTAFAIVKKARHLGFINPVLWIYHPYAIVPAGQFREKLVCYDCNDDLSFFFSQNFDKRKKLSAIETRLTKIADIVFATSKNLFKLRKELNTNTYYLPSAVDVELFKKSNLPGLRIAPQLEAISKPIIGFMGGMENAKMNWQWIKETALSRPNWNLVFVGPCFSPPPSYITEQKNIIFLGAKPQETLPAYLKGFDVGIIPYQGETFLKTCQPTKTFEYLAAGKPVVTSWISELVDYQGIIFLSHDVQEFIKNIELALVDGKDDSRIKLYIQTAHGYTWDDRVEEASKLMSGIIKSRSHA